MAEIVYGNPLQYAQQGLTYGRQIRAQNEARADQQQLRQLAPGVIQGDPNAYAQAAAIDPEAAGQYQQAGDVLLRRLKGGLQLIDSAQDPRAKQAYWEQVRPFFIKNSPPGTPEPPLSYEEAAPHLEGAKAKIAMIDEPKAGRVQSTYVDAQGNRVGVMADGTTQILGQNAPNNQIIDTGNGFYGVNKGNLQAAPVMTGGQTSQPQVGTVFTAPDGMPTVIDDAGVDPRVAANIQSNPGWASAPDGATASMPVQNGAPGNAGQLRSAPKPPSASDQLAMDAYQKKTTRTLTPQEAQAAGFRPGTIVQQDGYGNNKVVQAPETDRQAMSDAQRKDMLARRAKIPQVQNVTRGLSRIDSALQKLNGALLDTGPVDAKIQQYTPAGQELEAAVGAIQNSMLALTRVPGIGSQSDLEARIANMQYPSLDKAPDVNRRTMENLKAFAADLKAAYDSAAEQDKQMQSQPTAPVPAQDDDVSDLLSKYGLD